MAQRKKSANNDGLSGTSIHSEEYNSSSAMNVGTSGPDKSVEGYVPPTFRESNLLHALNVLWKWKWFVIINTVAICFLVLVISLFVPNRYKAVARIIPPKQPDVLSMSSVSGSALRSLTGGLSRLGGLLGGTSNTYNYLAILKSRETSEEIVRSFNLPSVYDTKNKSIERAIEELEGYVSFDVETDDYISISVLDKDPERAAAMANTYVDILNRRSIQLAIQEARNNREFIEKSLKRTYADLALYEEELKQFQSKTGLVVNPSATSAGLGAVAELFALKVKKEIELGILQRTVDADNPLFKQAQVELSEINKKLSNIPDAGVDAIRIYRNILIQQKILEFVVPLYEQAKVDEARSIPVLLVLDKAIAPERKTTPKRMLITVLTGVVTLMVITIIVFMLNGFLSALPGENDFAAIVKRISERLGRLYRVPV